MKRLLYIMMLLLPLSLQAQTAKQILDKTAAVVGNKGGATANFTLSGKYGNASGSIAIKGKKFCAQTPQATTWYDGKTQWTYVKKNQEVNVSTPSPSQQQSMNPYTFINIYKMGYDMSAKKVGAGYEVHLKAQKKQAIKELYVTVNKNYQPTQVKMLNDKGWSTITITNFKKASLSDTAFRFNSKDYPNAEVIDLR